MGTAIIKKTFRAVFLVWSALTLAFLVLHLLPGSPIQQILGVSFYNQEVLSALSSKYGLNQPLYMQYYSFAKGFFAGDLGESIRSGLSVKAEIVNRLRNSLTISGASLVVSLAVSLAISCILLLSPLRLTNVIVKRVVLFLSSTPPFIVGIAVLLMAGLVMNLSIGGSTVGFVDVSLAVLTLVIVVSSYLLRHVQSFLEEESERLYILALISRGIPRSLIIVKHVLRNALGPILSVTGLIVGYLIVGTVIVEVIFGIPGVGSMFYEGLLFRDYPVVQAVMLSSITVFAVTNLVVDIMQILIDPRLRV